MTMIRWRVCDEGIAWRQHRSPVIVPNRISADDDAYRAGGPMPLITVTMRAGRSADETESLSRAIHAASIAAGYPADDLFPRFLSLEPGHFRVDPRYPALPKPRTGQMLLIEVLVSSGTETERKRALVKSLV